MGIDDRLAERMSMAEQHEYLRAKLSRRRVIRGGAAAAGVAAGAGLLGSSAYPAYADTASRASGQLSKPATGEVDGKHVAPFGRHLAFGADPKTQFRISWQVPPAVRKPFVRVGLKPWDLGKKIEAEVRPLHTAALTSALPAVDQYYLHAALDGLPRAR